MKLDNKKKFWWRAGIGLSVVLIFSLLMSYQLQTQKRDALEKEIENVREQQTMLRNAPMPDLQQLSFEYESLKRDITAQESNLSNAIGSNGIRTLVSIANEESITLTETRAVSMRNIDFEGVPYEVATLQVNANGRPSNLMNFIMTVSKKLGVIKTLVFDIPGGSNNSFTANFQVDIYSYSK